MELLQALSEWPIATALRQSSVAYPLLNAAHILSISLVVGAIIVLDLRLLGLFRKYPVGSLAPPLWRVAATGVVLAAITGFLLFSVRPVTYAQNPAFLIKLGLVGLGVLNALALHYNRHWQLAVRGGELQTTVRISAMLSLAVWVGAVIAGRWIGFLQ